ncbi:hypothetical protein [Flavobacterium sp.]|jgi:hypothetical protein|uniref:hypothetical protein n=1 Tax=Flavobacterium sp. TaxID=239 RepID=UPI0037837F35
MKKILSVVTLLFLLNSCSPESDTRYSLELLPVESVEIPTEMTLGETYQFKMYYRLPSTCHSYNTIYYHKDLNVRTVAVESLVREQNNCQEVTENNLYECTFDFVVTSNGSYVFKFWQGEDAQGNDIFLEYEIPVLN